MKILVVDDEPDILEMTRIMLESSGFYSMYDVSEGMQNTKKNIFKGILKYCFQIKLF